MPNEMQGLIDEYVRWLKDNTSTKELSGSWIEITTPFLDRHNDFIQIYAKKENEKVYLTDDGYILDDLRMSGFEFKTPKRKQILKQVLNGFGVQLVNDRIEVETSSVKFPEKKHDIIQAMISVNDMFVLAEPTVASVFYEDVSNWFSDNNIRAIERVKITGKSGFSNSFDFAIPKSASYPERLVQVINNPSKNTAERAAFTWIDSKDFRIGAKAYAIINDSIPDKLPEVMAALVQYDVEPLKWSERNSYLGALAG